MSIEVCSHGWVFYCCPECVREIVHKPSSQTVEELKREIRAARYSWVIKDPYPPDRSEVSVYKAWQDAFNFAWSLIEDKLK
jgi:hypothetical protein